jgi:NDP-sugar pyrophosphorylase family protein
VLGAIVVTGFDNLDKNPARGGSSSSPSSPLLADMSLECVELLGQSVLQRTIESLRTSVDQISLVPASDCAGNDRIFSIAKQCGISVSRSADPWSGTVQSGAVQKVREFEQGGVDTLLLIGAGTYVELDLPDLVQFHREKAQKVTSVCDAQGPLSVWLIDAGHLPASPDLLTTDHLTTDHSLAEPCYMVRGYVNRLGDSLDLRRLVVDAFNSRCQLRPEGREIQPAVWLADGGEVHRGARLIAPLYIGARSKIGNDCLITECSNIERDCEIDDGTTVSDSSVLENSYVGIGLEISRSIVSGSKLQNLERQATVTISDAAVMRPNRPVHKELPDRAPAAAPNHERVLLAPAEEGAS